MDRFFLVPEMEVDQKGKETSVPKTEQNLGIFRAAVAEKAIWRMLLELGLMSCHL